MLINAGKSESAVIHFLPSVDVFVNDTLTGDPLMTVPIRDDPNVRPGDPISSLCYEVHGESNQFFNLISDGCTSVNAYYEKALIASPNIDLNVITQIGVRAVGEDSTCSNIEVDLNWCSAIVNNINETDYNTNGIWVKRFASSSRVRISVPNCAATKLVMWVFCAKGHIADPLDWTLYDAHFIRFVIMRGLNLNEWSHGLIGMV